MPMSFSFYPKHEHGCPNVSHCPHLGGAALGTLVLLANQTEESREYLFKTLDAERERNARLVEENDQLKVELQQVKLELKLERQNKFATNGQKQAATASAAADNPTSSLPKKRGAPVGHPGWFRKTPIEYDWAEDVPAPSQCPHCKGRRVTVDPSFKPSEHLQEDLIDGQYRVVLYRHPAACCTECGEWLQQPGEGELLGSRLGPHLRSKVIYYSVLNGQRAYFWVHATTRHVHFSFGTTRSGQVSRDVLGNDFSGTLVTDCYSGYFAHSAGAKQKCLAHLARTARDWQKLTKPDSPAFAFFEAVKQFVKRGCAFHRLRRHGQLDVTQQAAEKTWLRAELVRLEAWVLSGGKALTLQSRITGFRGEWLVFVDDARVPPTNNLAEQALRPLVVLRKITFGHRSLDGRERMAAIMSVAETARRHGHRASQIFLALMTHPPNKVLRQLYAEA
jgi:hypothetical protein